MKKFLALFSFVFVLTSCVTQGELKPLTQHGATQHKYATEEGDLFQKSTGLRQELEEKGLILRDKKIAPFIARLGARVTPKEASGKYNFYVVRDPSVNAFALPNGDIYLNLGLIAHFNNERDIAFIIAHELSHVIHRHSLKHSIDTRTKMYVAHAANLLLMGDSVAYLPFMLSITQHSQEHESEADAQALKILASRNYKMAGIENVFAKLGEVKNPLKVKGSIWSSHPSHKYRKKAVVTELKKGKLRKNPNGLVSTIDYRNIHLAALEENIDLQLRYGKYAMARIAVKKALKNKPKSAKLHYLQGEAYRQMADNVNSAARDNAKYNQEDFTHEGKKEFTGKQKNYYQQALVSYTKAMQLNPNFYDSYKGKGLVQHKLGNKQSAKKLLNVYINQPGRVKDRRYVKSILRRIG